MSLLVQIAAMVAAGVALALALRGIAPIGVRVGILAASLAILGVSGVNGLWDASRELDRLHDEHSRKGEEAGRLRCTVETGVDPDFIRWLANEVPARETYYVAMPEPHLARTADLCVHMLLLPRVRVDSPARAQNILIWELDPRRFGAELARPGARSKAFDPRHGLIAKP